MTGLTLSTPHYTPCCMQCSLFLVCTTGTSAGTSQLLSQSSNLNGKQVSLERSFFPEPRRIKWHIAFHILSSDRICISLQRECRSDYLPQNPHSNPNLDECFVNSWMIIRLIQIRNFACVSVEEEYSPYNQVHTEQCYSTSILSEKTKINPMKILLAIPKICIVAFVCLLFSTCKLKCLLFQPWANSPSKGISI